MRSLRRISVEKRNSLTSTTAGSNSSKSTSETSSCSRTTFSPDQHRETIVNPKHISISYASTDHDLVYESVVLFYSLSAFLLQLLHLYRTVWWLPQSYEQNAVKFYLVNPYVIGYVFTLVGARWLWTCCKTIIANVFPQTWQKRARHYCQVSVLLVLGLAHFYFISLIASSEDSSDEEPQLKINKAFLMGCLLYPSFVMATIYQEEIKSFLELIPDSGADALSTSAALNSSLSHRCSNDPVQVREEADMLRQDFNQRLRSVLFHSHTIAVACALLPCCFAQTFVHFDIYIAVQHFILVWSGSLTLNAVHAFPPKYCDILHSSARHLGHWDHVGTSNSYSNSAQCVEEWCPNTIWKQGSLVRSDNEIYRARSDVNSAEPGSVHHERFYALFINAALFQVGLLVFQLILVLLQLFLLFRSSEWYQMISLSLLQASGGYALFKLMRDAVVCWRISLAEEMMKTVQ